MGPIVDQCEKVLPGAINRVCQNAGHRLKNLDSVNAEDKISDYLCCQSACSKT